MKYLLTLLMMAPEKALSLHFRRPFLFKTRCGCMLIYFAANVNLRITVNHKKNRPHRAALLSLTSTVFELLDNPACRVADGYLVFNTDGDHAPPVFFTGFQVTKCVFLKCRSIADPYA
jgi:hypothetical protein